MPPALAQNLLKYCRIDQFNVREVSLCLEIFICLIGKLPASELRSPVRIGCVILVLDEIDFLRVHYETDGPVLIHLLFSVSHPRTGVLASCVMRSNTDGSERYAVLPFWASSRKRRLTSGLPAIYSTNAFMCSTEGIRHPSP